MKTTENQKQRVGKFGEKKAVQFIRKNGYTILETNWRHAHQEIDVIAKDAEYLVFFEVKTRSCLSPDDLPFGRPARAVNAEKQKNLIFGARAYLREHPELALQPRMDVIEVYVRPSRGMLCAPTVLRIHHIRNAFGAR